MLRTFMLFALVFSSVSIFAAGSDSWKIVKNGDVCMVTNMHFARTQIPVEQDGKTYYGCCENCKATIQNDKSVRFAEDPYSKKQVDKAKATIAANDQGAVLYFESASNFEKYQKKLKRDGK